MSLHAILARAYEKLPSYHDSRRAWATSNRPFTDMSWREPRTARPDQSIWRDISEDTFRRHLVKLEECTNAVPSDMQIFPVKEWSHSSCEGSHVLPLEIEQQLADDLAFLSAVEEGAQSVSAACVEEHTDPPGLVVRFAALDVSLNDTTKTALEDISKLLMQCVLEGTIDKSYYVDLVFHRVVDLHSSRLLARLRSVKWQKPKYLSKSHKKPLWRDFANLVHRVQFLFTKKEALQKQVLHSHLHRLASCYESFEAVKSGSQEEMAHMRLLVKNSYDFCKEEQVQNYAQRLQSSINGTPTKQVGAAVKTFRQIEKMAAYWRISSSLIDTARCFPSLFQQSLRIKYMSPFKSLPTAIGYESWAKTCHVHAEVQLAVHYDIVAQHQKAPSQPPRAIGTSKFLCYLCFQFLRAHKRYFPSNTHGRLYDQWTIPDLEDYDEKARHFYRGIIKSIDDEVIKETRSVCGPESQETGVMRWRSEPMTSRQNLLDIDEVVHEHEIALQDEQGDQQQSQSKVVYIVTDMRYPGVSST